MAPKTVDRGLGPIGHNGRLRLRWTCSQCECEPFGLHLAFSQKDGDQVCRSDERGRHCPIAPCTVQCSSECVEPSHILRRCFGTRIDENLQPRLAKGVRNRRHAEALASRLAAMGWFDYKTRLLQARFDAAQRPFACARTCRFGAAAGCTAHRRRHIRH